jgi:hypothetical protein
MKHFRGGIRGFIASAALLGVLAYAGVAGFFYEKMGSDTIYPSPFIPPAFSAFL